MRTKRVTRSYRFGALDEVSKAGIRRPVQSMVVRTAGKPPASFEAPSSERRPTDASPPESAGETSVSVDAELLVELLSLTAGDRVLDVGCRADDALRAFSPVVGPAGSVYGLVPSMREAGVSPAGSNRRLFVGEPENLPFPHHRFDACMAVDTLVNRPRPSRIVDEMVRVVVPGGRIVLSEQDWRTLVISDDDLATATALVDACCARVATPHAGASLVTMLAQRGMRDVVVIPTSTCFRRLRDAEDRLGLADGLARACAAGRLDRLEATALRRRLEAADAAGAFFASITGFVVAGTRR